MDFGKLVSIIIPAYNAHLYIAATIESILDQTYQNWELIICDDGSRPTLEEVVGPFLADERISYRYKTNSGVSDTRNFGFSFSKGEYIVFFDADDIMQPKFLEERLLYLIKNEEIDFVASKIRLIDEAGNFIGEEQMNPVCVEIQKEVLFYDNTSFSISCPSVYMFRRNVCNEVSFNTEVSSPADRLFLLDVSIKHNGGIIGPGGNMLLYRIGPSSMSGNKVIGYYLDNIKFYKLVMKRKNRYPPLLLRKFRFGHGKFLAYGLYKYRKYVLATRFLIISFLSQPSYYFRKIGLKKAN